MRTDEELVVAARTGEADAFASLVERWTGRCWDIAWRILRDRELAADVAQETLLTAWQQLGRLDQPASFGGWVSRIARNRALDRLEKERRAVSTGDDEMLERIGAASATGGRPGDPVAELDTAQRQELVWAAAAALGERDASVLDLHLRHGLEPAELATELGIAPNNAHQVLFRLRKRLGGAIRAWLLWRGGHPRCERLEADLVTAGVETFGAQAVAVIDEHADACPMCDRDRAAVVAPAAMFSAVPFVAIPAVLRSRVLAELQQAGVPVPAGATGSGTADGGGRSGDGGGGSEGSGQASGTGEVSGDGTPSGQTAGGDRRSDAVPGDSAEAPLGSDPGAGAGDSAEAHGGDSAEADGGDSAEADGGDSAEADGGDSAEADGGGSAEAAGPWTRVLAATAAAVGAVVLLWLLIGPWGTPASEETLTADPADGGGSAPGTDVLPAAEDDDADVAPLPRVPAGRDDPTVVPAVPPGPWRSGAVPEEESPREPETEDAAEPEPEAEQPDPGPETDPEPERDPERDPEQEPDPEPQPDPEPDPEPLAIDGFRVVSVQDVDCADQQTSNAIRASWVTTAAESVELEPLPGTPVSGLPLVAEDLGLCIDQPASSFRLLAYGADGSAVDEVTVIE